MSLINIVNNSEDHLQLGIYTTRPTENVEQSAWITQSLNSHTSASFSARQKFTVHANYGNKLAPDGGQKTNSMQFLEGAAKFQVVNAGAEGEQNTKLKIEQLFEDLVPNKVSLHNMSNQGIWAHIERAEGGSFAPVMMSPGAVLIEDVSAMPFYLAIIKHLVTSSDEPIGELIHLPATAITSGQTATITGSNWRGYTIALSE
ncbi:hypothetical protein [Arenicella xantha]|uniref:Uncharacterized protein n=1 Tax=Arenicella xantha TaxID=644221 RepID=A0A395JKL3_9GAMM|nr:hypothetical protein [Arenicella xantha]RBP51336.1 hypothetical protein DFR28_102756 [Arenicella xantha]